MRVSLTAPTKTISVSSPPCDPYLSTLSSNSQTLSNKVVHKTHAQLKPYSVREYLNQTRYGYNHKLSHGKCNIALWLNLYLILMCLPYNSCGLVSRGPALTSSPPPRDEHKHLDQETYNDHVNKSLLYSALLRAASTNSNISEGQNSTDGKTQRLHLGEQKYNTTLELTSAFKNKVEGINDQLNVSITMDITYHSANESLRSSKMMWNDKSSMFKRRKERPSIELETQPNELSLESNITNFNVYNNEELYKIEENNSIPFVYIEHAHLDLRGEDDIISNNEDELSNNNSSHGTMTFRQHDFNLTTTSKPSDQVWISTNESYEVNKSSESGANFTRRRRPGPRTRTISLLGLFELSARGGARPDGHSELAAARLAVRHVNRRRLLPGYRLRLLTNDTQCDPGVGVDRFFHALYTRNTTRMVMLLGSACSEVTESLAKVVPYWNIVQVSFGSTSPALSDRNEFPLFYRTVAPDSSHNPARIAFIRELGWDTVAAFWQNEEVHSLAVHALLAALEDANVTCAASISFARTDYREQMQLLKDLDIRIIIGSFSSEMLPIIFCEAHRLGMFGADYAWIIQGGALAGAGGARGGGSSTPACPPAQLAAALERLVLVASYNTIVRDDEASLSGLTNNMFVSSMRRVGVAVSAFAPQTYDAVWAMALALRSAQAAAGRGGPGELHHFDYTRRDMADQFLHQLGRLHFLGVSGPVSFTGSDRVGTSAFYQIQDGEVRTVALYECGGAGVRAGVLQFSCPGCARLRWGRGGVGGGAAPVSRRRVLSRPLSVSRSALAAVSALAALGAALALAFCVFNLHYSKLRSIKLSSPRLNTITLAGCILVYGGVALLGLDGATTPSFMPFSAVCSGRVYLFSAGFSMAFGSIFAKTYRVHRIFLGNRSGVCKTKLLQDTQLISLVCALLLIDGLIVTLWVVVDPLERHLKNLTIEISTTDRSVVYQPQIEVCRSQNTTGWLSVLYAYKGIILMVGLYMAWETRHVKISALNDSKYIGISVYSVVITSASVVVLGNLISERTTLAYVTITSLILISTTATLCLLFLPKILSILDDAEDDDPVIQSMGLKIECNTRRFVTDDKQELQYRVEVQNKVYRKEMAALDKEILRLEKMLIESNTTSSSSSTSSLTVHRKSDLTAIPEYQGRDQQNDNGRTPSITGGLPLLLLSVLPPVIPRASWPSADSCQMSMRRSVTFSSQPKLNDQKSQPSIDLYHLCLNKRNEENTGFLNRLKNLFGSRSSSRKASNVSIAGPSGQGIAAALKLHMGMLAGLVPAPNKRQNMMFSCNTLNLHEPHKILRKESFAQSGPIVHIVNDDASDSPQRKRSESFLSEKSNRRDSESQPKVNFQLPAITKHQSATQQSSQAIMTLRDRVKGSPRFPHKIVPTTSSLSTLDDCTSSNILHISGNNVLGPIIRRSSHQPPNNSKHNSEDVMSNKWKSMEDASLTLPGSQRGNSLLAMSYIPSNIYQTQETSRSRLSVHIDVWGTADHGIPLSELTAEFDGIRTKFVRKQTSNTSLN